MTKAITMGAHARHLLEVRKDLCLADRLFLQGVIEGPLRDAPGEIMAGADGRYVTPARQLTPLRAKSQEGEVVLYQGYQLKPGVFYTYPDGRVVTNENLTKDDVAYIYVYSPGFFRQGLMAAHYEETDPYWGTNSVKHG